MKDATHAFCSECNRIRKCVFEPLTAESIDGKYLGGDIVCECKLVVATLFREVAGEK